MDRSELKRNMVGIAKEWCKNYRADYIDYYNIRVHFRYYKGLMNHIVGELGHIVYDGCEKARRNREEVLCVFAYDTQDTIHVERHVYGECPKRLYGMKAKEEYANQIPKS